MITYNMCKTIIKTVIRIKRNNLYYITHAEDNKKTVKKMLPRSTRIGIVEKLCLDSNYKSRPR